MRYWIVSGVAFVLWRGNPRMFAWDAEGFHTFLAFLFVLVVVTLVPGRHSSE